MQDNHYETTLAQAEQLLHFAEEEFYRPQEDVVLDQIGRHIQKATAHYLAAYLIKNAREVRPTTPIPPLLHLCKELEPKFAALEIDPRLLQDPEQFTATEINHGLAFAKKIGELVRQ